MKVFNIIYILDLGKKNELPLHEDHKLPFRPARKMLNQERVKRSLNNDIEDKENIPQMKGKLHTLPVEALMIKK